MFCNLGYTTKIGARSDLFFDFSDFLMYTLCQLVHYFATFVPVEQQKSEQALLRAAATTTTTTTTKS